MDQQTVITMLNEDIRGEHAAIIQYLLHAYALGETAEAGEIEAIAREEMRHLKWLSELVAEMGGDPTIERGKLDMSGTGPVDWMARDVVAEDEAIALYREHIAAIDDPKVQRLLRRIVDDELAHKGIFADLADELAEEKREAGGVIRPEDAAAEPSRALEVLLQGVQHEYTVVLQYLYHSFVTPHCEVAEEMEWQAINEMQHLGWFAEEMADRGAYPAIEHAEVDRSQDTPAMLEADIAAERAVIQVYEDQIEELQTSEETELVDLLTRVRDQEIYHDALFGDMLEELEGEPTPPEPEPEPPAEPKPDWTVGSMLGRKQE